MDRRFDLRTTGADDTRRLAGVVAGALRPGDVVSLTGELGAGKTCFVQGAAAALGVAERITSPSFLLRRDYEGVVPVTHLDVYRLETLQDVVELGYGEAGHAGRVVFIEWGDAMAPLLPADYLEVEFRYDDAAGRVQAPAGTDSPDDPQPAASAVDGDETRTVILRAHGDQWLHRVVPLAVDARPWRVGLPDDAPWEA